MFKPFFRENACIFNLFQNLDKMMQSSYLFVILHVKHKKLLIVTVFARFLILEKIQDGDQDGDHIW